MKTDFKRAFISFLFPLTYVALLWLVKVVELYYDYPLFRWGVFPQTFSGLRGIVFSPLIHSGFDHLMSNTLPLLVLGTALFYFYRELALKVTLFSWLISGFWVWVFARSSYHIGASGIIYAWASFLFVSGLLRSHPRLMALSLLVTFLYGSLVWGIFPLKERMSWEGHLMGLLSGIVMAWFYKEKGPQRRKYSWELEDEEDEIIDPDNPPYWMAPHTPKAKKQKAKEADSHNTGKIQVRYQYKPGDNTPKT